MAGSSCWARSLFFITRCHQICSAIKIFTLIRSEQPSWASLMLPALWPHSRGGRPPLDSHCSQYPGPVFFLNLCRAKVEPHCPDTAGIHIIKLFRPSVYTIGPSHSLITVTHTELIKCQAMRDGIKFRGRVVPWSGPVDIDNIISALLALTHNPGPGQGSAMGRKCNPSQYCSEKCCLSDNQKEILPFPV